MNNYVAHFHETVEYDVLNLYWRKVAYNEVFRMMPELHPRVDLASVKEEFLPAESSTPTDDAESSNDGKGQAQPWQDKVAT